MEKVYICSPFKGNVEENIKLARDFSRLCYKKGKLPICVHIYLEEATGLHERNGDREELLDLGREFVKMCDTLWICGNVISEGMGKEIQVAEEQGLKIIKMRKEEIIETFI